MSPGLLWDHRKYRGILMTHPRKRMKTHYRRRQGELPGGKVTTSTYTEVSWGSWEHNTLMRPLTAQVFLAFIKQPHISFSISPSPCPLKLLFSRHCRSQKKLLPAFDGRSLSLKHSQANPWTETKSSDRICRVPWSLSASGSAPVHSINYKRKMFGKSSCAEQLQTVFLLLLVPEQYSRKAICLAITSYEIF